MAGRSKISSGQRSRCSHPPHLSQYDETIRGHIFCSFLALILREELEDRLVAVGQDFEWADIVQDLQRPSQTNQVERDGKVYLLHDPAPRCAGPAQAPEAMPQTLAS